MEITKIKPAFTDERGSITDVLTNIKLDHVGIIISKKGSIRAKHFHKEQKQWTIILRGKLKIVQKNLLDDSSQIETVELNPMELIVTPPYHYHSHEALEDTEFLVFTTKSRNGTSYEDDTFRISDINSFELKN